MIVRNEEGRLPACLKSVVDLVQEIVVVDTGSKDRTKDVAASFGAKVQDFAWADNFAAARNESLRHATGERILWLDADERLDEINRERVRSLLACPSHGYFAHLMTQKSHWNTRTKSELSVSQVRLFRNHPQVRWEGRVHEQILPSIRRLGWQVQPTEVVIHHTGYEGATVLKEKRERNLRLLNLEVSDNPDNPIPLFYLGWGYQEMGRHNEALPFLERSLAKCAPTSPLVPKLYALLTQIHGQLGQAERAQAACKNGRQRFPDDQELLFLEGRLLIEQGELSAAERALLGALNSKASNYLIGLDPVALTCQIRHSLAVLYLHQAKIDEARAQWEQILREGPDFAAAQDGLNELFGDLGSRNGKQQETAGRNGRERALEAGPFSNPNRPSLNLPKAISAPPLEERSQKEWIIGLPKISRRWVTVLGFAALGVVLRAVLIGQLASTPVSFAVVFFALLSGFSALWSP